MKELIEIQNELKVLKDQSKSGIQFKYRTCEQIFQEVKPLCKKYGVLLTVSDEVVNVGERYYIRATATVQKDGVSISASGLAREPDKLMSMSFPQITGSCSSYARKTAMGGLFNLDDNHDPDSDNGKTDKQNEIASKHQIDLLHKCVEELREPYPVRSEGLNKLITDNMFSEEADKLYNSACKVLGRKI